MNIKEIDQRDKSSIKRKSLFLLLLKVFIGIIFVLIVFEKKQKRASLQHEDPFPLSCKYSHTMLISTLPGCATVNLKTVLLITLFFSEYNIFIIS